MLALQEAGYEMAVPFGENVRYELVIDDGARLARVQCKTGRLRNGAVRFATCSCYAHHSRPLEARRDYLGQIDYFAVFCRETSGVYLIPIGDVATRTKAMLRVEPARNSQQKRIRLASDYQIGTVEGPASISYASTSRVFWCAMIFRLTRWRALSIVFVSQPRPSAMSS